MTRISTLMGASALCAMAAPAFAEKWDMPLAYPAGNYHSVNAADFGTCVGAKTNGALEIVTHPGGSLFAGNDIKRAVQTGQAVIGERLMSAHQNENPLFGIDSLPFLVSSYDEAEKLWALASPKIAEALDAQNLVYLYSVPWPPQGFYFKKEVNSAADMAGVKFRAYNSATSELAELTKMTPVQVEAAELSQALATGVAESFISSGATGYDSKVWEHLTHFYEVDAWLSRNTVFVNKDTFTALDDATRTALLDCAAEAKARGLQTSKDYATFTLNGLKENGMTVGRAGDQLVTDLKAVGATMVENWLATAGDDGKAIIDAYRASQ